jgi:hypothetical protein
MAALGAAGALMLMVREQDVFFGVAVAMDWILARGLPAHRRATREGGRDVARGPLVGVLAALGCFLVAYSPQVVTYYVLNGHFGPHASVGNKMAWTAPHALQVMFSPEHGFFIWTPLALIAIGGLVLAAFERQDRVWFILLLMVGLQIYVGGSVQSWTVAGGFAQRRLISLTAMLVIGYSAWSDYLQARVRGAVSEPASARLVSLVLFRVLTALCVYWNVALTAEFATGLMDRQKLDPRTNAYHAFVTLPRMAPSLAYRYLFERSSFYKPR